MPFINDIVFDSGLVILDTQATSLYINDIEASGNYTNAITTYNLGVKHGITIGAPADGVTNGRRVTVSSISDGVVSSGNTASFWAIVDSGNSRVLATGSLTTPQVVSSGNTFTLTAFDISIPDPA